ncbi:hypothetical protein ABIB40_002762 [Pedobacter sp. UYP30]|uniref:hypothetical protein n=1 Tax=Pedobacter sp. UYP30 TaxID=1756400 RepID=UPI003393B657
MQYKSLDRFFKHIQLDISTVGADNIGRIRKVVNAEFALSDTGIISVGEQSYSKQDLLDVLDAPDVLDLLKAHHSISGHPLFLDFLLNGNFNPLVNLEVEELKSNAKVVELTSIATAVQFNKNQRKLLDTCQFQLASAQMLLLPMVRQQDSEVALQAMRVYIEEGIYFFKNTNKVTHFEKLAEINRWTLDWAQWINEVPDLLLDQKRELATKLINYCVEIQNEDKKSTYLFSRQLVQLSFLTTANRKVVVSNHAVFEKNVALLKILPKALQRKYSKTWSFRTVWLVLVGLIFLGRFLIYIADYKKGSVKLDKGQTAIELEEATNQYLKKNEDNIFNYFKTFKQDTSAIILSNKANFISYLYLDSAKRGIKIQNTTKTDFVLLLSYKDGLIDFRLPKGKMIDFNYSNGEAIHFLLFSNAKMEGKSLNRGQLIDGKWIALKEKGATIDVGDLIAIDSNTVLNVANPSPPRASILLRITQTGSNYYLHHDDAVEVATKKLEK